MIVLEGVERVQGGVRVLGPIDFALTGQGITVLLGPNGAGKTNLLRVLQGLDRPSAGRVALDADQNRQDHALVFQEPVLLQRSVLANAAYPLELRGASRITADEKALEALKSLSLGGMARQQARSLSGGEKQKLALARALVTGPKIVFLDEPTSNLDGPATREIEETLKAAAKDGVRVVLSTHDFGQARRLADEVVFLLKGRIHESGPAAAFFASPKTAEAQAFLAGEIV